MHLAHSASFCSECNKILCKYLASSHPVMTVFECICIALPLPLTSAVFWTTSDFLKLSRSFCNKRFLLAIFLHFLSPLFILMPFSASASSWPNPSCPHRRPHRLPLLLPHRLLDLGIYSQRWPLPPRPLLRRILPF